MAEFPCYPEMRIGTSNMKYAKFKDPADKLNMKPTPTDPEFSYLARWADQGWSIQIYPKLDDRQWRKFNQRADETYNEELQNYDVNKALFLLRQLFPLRRLTILVPPPPKKGKEQ